MSRTPGHSAYFVIVICVYVKSNYWGYIGIIGFRV